MIHDKLLPVLLSLTILALTGFVLYEFDDLRRETTSKTKTPVAAASTLSRTSVWYNDKTTRFYVDGAALPEVEFDIGESYAGLLPVDDRDKELFFWFVPSRDPAAADEVVVWLNGGPGCSSMYGFLGEQGPVRWAPGTPSPVRNEWSWNTITNTVWIDQPVGTGFSRGTPNITSSEEAAVQFLAFWKRFSDTFGLQGKKVYLAGESFAGQWIPYIADAMLDQADPWHFNMSGVILYDPSFGWPEIQKQVPAAAFVKHNKDLFNFNETYHAHVDEMSSMCGYDEFMAAGLIFPPTGPLPPPPTTSHNDTEKAECQIYRDIYGQARETNPCFDIYNIAQLCPRPWDVFGLNIKADSSPVQTDSQASLPYFQREDVMRAIHASEDAHWKLCADEPVLGHWSDDSPPSALTGGPLQRVVEATGNVIVAHGSLDMILISNGTLLTLQNMTWNGMQGFSEPPAKPWYVAHQKLDAAASYNDSPIGYWTEERGLTFCTVELSGHEIPAYQPAAAFRHLEVLLGRIPDLAHSSRMR